MELVEWRFQIAGLDTLLVEEDALVEGFVEIPANLVGSVGVARFGVGHETESAEKDLRADRQYCAGIGQAGFGGGSFGLDAAKLLSDFGLWKLIIGEEVEKSILLGFELFEFAADGCMEFGDAVLFPGQCLFEQRADVIDEGGWQVQRGVVIDDRLLYLVDG